VHALTAHLSGCTGAGNEEKQCFQWHQRQHPTPSEQAASPPRWALLSWSQRALFVSQRALFVMGLQHCLGHKEHCLCQKEHCFGCKEHCLCHKEHCLGRNEHGFKHCLSWGLIWHGRPSYFCVTNRECGQGVPISCGQGRPSPRNQARRSQVFPPGLNNSRGERKPATPLGLVPYAWLSGSNLQQQTVRSKALTPAL